MKTASPALQRSGSYHSLPPSLQTNLLRSCRTTLCAVMFFTQNISLHIFFFYCVSPAALQAHYLRIMFGNVKHAALCSRVALHSAQDTGHWCIYIYIDIIIFTETTTLLVFPNPVILLPSSQQMQFLLGFFERAATKSASKSDKWSGNKSWINDEVLPIRGSLAYMDRRRWLII